ncbi:MAG: hypothetical protein GX139_01235 [Armatimonadetes bacterium]|jgi:sugar (pentulose or hexulose) kinase|nr:hypothetical protein [Armatimonadota bacterium]
MKYALGLDISTQTITAMLIGVVETNGLPTELILSEEWIASRPCRDNISRKSPEVWVELARECIEGLKSKVGEAEQAEAIGVSTTFPGCFAILRDGTVDPRFVSLYDNTADDGVCGGEFDVELGRAESETLNRMWPGNMAIGLAHLMISQGLSLEMVAGIAPPNTAFASQLLRVSGNDFTSSVGITDFSEAVIGGLYDVRSGSPLPPAVDDLLTGVISGLDSPTLRNLLPKAAPSWRNIIPGTAIDAVRNLFGLAELKGVSIGAGDSPLAALALSNDTKTVINVRGSSDSPMILIKSPINRNVSRENVLHYPMPTATDLTDSPWCVVAPMLRSGRVWDWVRRLRFDDEEYRGDEALEALALQAAVKRTRTPLRFDTALGGERAPEWDSTATGSIVGLAESHTIGDIALAALEGMSNTLAECINVMERRYRVSADNLLLAGGPAKNRLWNWITRQRTGKKTFATTFSDASVLGAALLGYATLYDGVETERAVASRLMSLSRLSANHELIAPVEVNAPAAELLEQ